MNDEQMIEAMARTMYEAYEGEWLGRPGHPGWEGEDDDTRRDYFRQARAVLPIAKAAREGTAHQDRR